MSQLTIRQFRRADESREFPLGQFDLITLCETTIGHARYEPGWRWSTHVGPISGTPLCTVEHLGFVLTGRAAVKMENGDEAILSPGDLFFVSGAHDSWVVGDEAYESLQFLNAASYARSKGQET